MTQNRSLQLHAMMDSVEREAQARGYSDGRRGCICSPGAYGQYANLLASYKRGWTLGHEDYETEMSQLAALPVEKHQDVTASREPKDET